MDSPPTNVFTSSFTKWNTSTVLVFMGNKINGTTELSNFFRTWQWGCVHPASPTNAVKLSLAADIFARSLKLHVFPCTAATLPYTLCATFNCLKRLYEYPNAIASQELHTSTPSNLVLYLSLLIPSVL